MDYKDTLKLPKTDFPMRANLPQREPQIAEVWSELGLNSLPREGDSDKPKFLLHDGPPYANGHIHVGTALNKVLKDVVLKSKSLEGFQTPYIPGWDCHGQPVEHAVVSKMGSKAKEMSSAEIRAKCRDYALRFLDIQRKEFKRLGVLGDWDNPYRTLNPTYEAEILRLVSKLVPYIYRSLKPVQWCRNCQTALAEAEVEYEDKSSPSIYVNFEISDPDALWNRFEETPLGAEKPAQMSVMVWTTTPWTLPANLAVSFHPDAEYVLAELEGYGAVLLAREMMSFFEEETGMTFGEILGSTPGRELEGLSAKHPFVQRESLFILGQHVTMEQGSGCVHTAPGHGQDDYIIGLKYDLPVYSPVDHEGRFTEEFPPMQGLSVEDANPKIIELLKEKNALVHFAKVQHSYPHCWRCKSSIIFRATPQWFISLEKNSLRERLLREIQQVEWIPAAGIERITTMVQRRAEWCISRQRHWGVPIPALYCTECEHPILDAELIDRAAGLVAKKGIEIWFAETEEERTKYEPEATELAESIAAVACPSCGSRTFRKEKDIFDVWLESGASHQAVIRTRPELEYPVDLYLEGSDQHRGWFQSSLTTAVGAGQSAPFKTVLTHGFVVDGDGRKMSKSIGNVIAPKEIINKYGADVLRLWVASEDFRGDIRISDEILKRLAEAYRKIRNTFRFMLGNLKDFSAENSVPVEERNEIDRFILMRFQKLGETCRRAYHNYEFHKVFQAINNFCIVDLSSFYLDIVKDRLYTWGEHSRGRNAALATIAEGIVYLTQLINPVLPYTGEEIWQQLKGLGLVEGDSINLSQYKPVPEVLEPELQSRWEKLLEIRVEVCRALELQRKEGNIGHPLDAKVILYSEETEIQNLLKQYSQEARLGDDLASLFICSQAEVSAEPLTGEAVIRGEEMESLVIKAAHADGEKCPRCWKYDEKIGCSAQFSDVCPNCAQALKDN